MSRQQLVVFDLGRVLIRICDSWRHACERAGIAVPTSELDSTADAALLELVKLSEVGRLSQEAFCAQAAPILGLTAAQVARLSDEYLLGPYPGVTELLDELNTVGVVTACLSNTNTNHWRMITDPASPNGLPVSRLDYRFASQLMGLRKPDDAIYAEVERVTGFAGEQIIFFDDLPANVDGAKVRGWNAIQIALDSDPVTQVRRHLREIGVLAT
jgi:HAD superfamily hydrolase (TIGR01509 family)